MSDDAMLEMMIESGVVDSPERMEPPVSWTRFMTTRQRRRERRELRALAKSVWPLDTDTAQLLLKRARNG